jgi:uncharacterized cupredoxin-like copper-binding protein
VSRLVSRRALPTALLVLGPLLVGCAAGIGAHASPMIEGAETIEVIATDFAFEPDVITITAGEPVNIVLVNEGRVQHDIAGRDPQFLVHAAPGAEETGGLVVDDPGTYELICSIPGHERQGMTFTLNVE